MISINFPPNTAKQDLRALYKRSNIVVFGKKYVYYRAAGAAKKDVLVHIYPDGVQELLATSCKSRMSAYKQGHEVKAPIEDVAWSERLVAASINNEKITGFEVRGEYFVEGGETVFREVHIKPSLLDIGADVQRPSMPSGSNTSVSLSSTIACKTNNPGSTIGLMPCKSEQTSQSTSRWSKKLSKKGIVMVDLDIDSENQTSEAMTAKVKKEPTSTSAAGASTSSWERPILSTPTAAIDLDDEDNEALNLDGTVDPLDLVMDDEAALDVNQDAMVDLHDDDVTSD